MIKEKALQLFAILSSQEEKLIISCAESCTGGMLSSAITAIPGSSKFFSHSLVVYSNQAKIDLLQVKESTIAKYGSVSPEVAKSMAIGSSKNIKEKSIAIAITGIAGPSGGTEEKPVGLIYSHIIIENNHFPYSDIWQGNRDEIREQTVIKTLTRLNQLLKKIYF